MRDKVSIFERNGTITMNNQAVRKISIRGAVPPELSGQKGFTLVELSIVLEIGRAHV